MLFAKVLVAFLTVSVVASHPVQSAEEGRLSVRADKKPAPKPHPAPKKTPAKPVPKKADGPPKYDPSTDYEEIARKQNNAAGRKICQQVSDCQCPMPDDGKTHSTSCINGFCSCDNSAVNFSADKFIQIVAALGNAPITRAIGQLMQGLADVEEVASVIAGAVLGPEAKIALKGALNAVPDTGPSHIDQASKNVLNKVLQ